MKILRYGGKLLVAVSAACLILSSAAGAWAAAPELTLADSVALALKNNPAVKLAASDRDRAAWAIEEARAGLAPTLSLNHADTRASAAEGLPASDSFSTSLRMNWPLYSGGRNEALVDQARKAASVAELGVTVAEQQLKLDVTNAYYGALQARNMVKVNDEAVASLSEHLQNVRAQFEAGTVAKADVLRSEVELANAQQNRIKAKNSYDVAIAALNNILGLSHDSASVLKDELSQTEYRLSLTDSISLAGQKRPEIRQADEAVAQARAGIKAADSGSLPAVNLTAAQGWTGNEFPGRDSNWSIGMSLSWNLFDAGLTKAKVEEARTAEDKTTLQAHKLRDDIALEVRQAYLNMTEAAERIQTARVAVDKASEDLKIARTKYSAGAGTNLDVIDAQLALTQAGTNSTQALYDYNTSRAKLLRATGQI